MTPVAQRLAMATLDGWFDFRRDLIHPEILFGTKSFGHIGCEEFEVPDYLRNLNDVAGVEEMLWPTGKEPGEATYRHLLNVATDFRAYHASAAQRVEAILKATDKWRDDL